MANGTNGQLLATLPNWAVNCGPISYTETNSGDFANGTLSNVMTDSGGNLVLTTGQTLGYRITPTIDISSLGQVANSIVSWTSNIPTGTNVFIESSVSLDSGISWGPWLPIAQGGKFNGVNYWTPPSIDGTPLQAARLRFRQTLSSATLGISPNLSLFSILIDPYSARGKSMMNGLPTFYSQGRVVQSFMQARGLEFDTILCTLHDVLNQFFVNTATWKLSDWESFVGLPDESSLTIDQRRAKIMARIRGYGTARISVVNDVASSFANGNIAVIENWEAYTITIRFIDQHGVPTNQADLQNALKEILPAHLIIKYEYTYTIWDRWDSLNMSWDTLDSLNLSNETSDTYI